MLFTSLREAALKAPQIKVQVHILKPMLYEEYKDMKTVEIAAEVKQRIEHVIQEYEGK